jgi:hypothetical protein
MSLPEIVPDWYVKAMTPKVIHVAVWGKDKDGKDVQESFDIIGFVTGIENDVDFRAKMQRLHEKYGVMKMEYYAGKD